MVSKETEIKLHNRGQADAAKGYGNFHSPNGWLRGILSDDLKAENDAYTKGYENGAEQRDRSSS